MNLDFGKILSIGAAPFTGGASLAYLGVSTAAELYGANRANQQARANVDRQIDFQREMADSAHQREVRDLRKAGLNPILSGTGGAGAASPGGAAAGAIAPDFARGANTALAARRSKALLEMEFELLQKRAQTEAWVQRELETRAMVNSAQVSEVSWRAIHEQQLARNAMLDQQVRRAGQPWRLDEQAMQNERFASVKRRADYYGSSLSSAVSTGAKAVGAFSAAQLSRAARAWHRSQAGRAVSGAAARAGRSGGAIIRRYVPGARPTLPGLRWR